MDLPKRTLLYYPTMVIENQKWIRQSILYWDEIGSIIPNEIGIDQILQSSYDMQILHGEGVFKAFRPERFVEENPGLADEFLSLMTEIKVNPQNYRESWILESKIYGYLVEMLIRKGVATQKDDRLYMDDRYVLLYMSLLAKYMANADSESITSPSTDNLSHLKLAFPTSTEGAIKGISLELAGILPTPKENVQVVDILRFKERRRDELKYFRQLVYEHQDKLKQAQDSATVRDVNARFAENLQVGVSNLCKAFKGDSIRYTLGSLRNIFLGGTPAVISAFIAQVSDPVKVALSVGGAVIGGAVSLKEYLLDARNKQNERLAQNSFSYIYLAQKTGIINSLDIDQNGLDNEKVRHDKKISETLKRMKSTTKKEQ